MLKRPQASVADLSVAARFLYGMGLPNKGRAHRVLLKLQSQGLVEKGRGGAWKLTTKGRKEAAEVAE